MARFEALIAPVADRDALVRAVAAVSAGLALQPDWVNEGSAVLRPQLHPDCLELQLVLEVGHAEALTVLLSSGERMGSGAPRSRVVLEKVLELLLQSLGASSIVYRSDRDGPVRPSLAIPCPSASG